MVDMDIMLVIVMEEAVVVEEAAIVNVAMTAVVDVAEEEI